MGSVECEHTQKRLNVTIMEAGLVWKIKKNYGIFIDVTQKLAHLMVM
jgi:hypothetical protein